MISNRFIRFLVNIPVMFVVLIIVGLIDIHPLFFSLLSLPIWFLFTIQKDLLDFPNSKFFVLIKNIFIIAMFAMSFLCILVGVALFFADQDAPKTILDSIMVVAPVVAFGFSLFFSNEDAPFSEFSYLGVPAITIISLLLSLLLGIVDIVETIAVIVLAVGSIPLLIVAFKLKWIEFASSYTPSSYSYNYSSGNNTERTPTSPSEAMHSIASKWSGSTQLTGKARFNYNISCSISGGAANFRINGSVFFSGINITSQDRQEAKYALEQELNFIKNNRILPSYNSAKSSLISKGISCSSINSVNVSRGNITSN